MKLCFLYLWCFSHDEISPIFSFMHEREPGNKARMWVCVCDVTISRPHHNGCIQFQHWSECTLCPTDEGWCHQWDLHCHHLERDPQRSWLPPLWGKTAQRHQRYFYHPNRVMADLIPRPSGTGKGTGSWLVFGQVTNSALYNSLCSLQLLPLHLPK